jgi:hypothetical protein
MIQPDFEPVPRSPSALQTTASERALVVGLLILVTAVKCQCGGNPVVSPQLLQGHIHLPVPEVPDLLL